MLQVDIFPICPRVLWSQQLGLYSTRAPSSLGLQLKIFLKLTPLVVARDLTEPGRWSESCELGLAIRMSA